MIILITAITPEAAAVLSELTMKRVDAGTLSLYESEDGTLRLLVTGSGKLNAAMAVTEYLTRCSCSQQDLFCNLGICGGTDDSCPGDGFFCAAVTEATTGRSFYPELYTHPFREARLLTSDTPVTALPPSSETNGTLPLLYDMEAFGIAAALFRRVMPSRCFFYKVVSDLCNGSFPAPEAVPVLLRPHIRKLVSFLQNKEKQFFRRAEEAAKAEQKITSMVQQLTLQYPFSAAMKHRLTGLLTYAVSAGFAEADILQALPAPGGTPHKKREALALLEKLTDYVLCPGATADVTMSPPTAGKRRRPFRHIYVEREVLSHPVTRRFTERFPDASVIPVEHYKAVFNRGRQDLQTQETEPAVVLAANHGTLFYPGAPVCQSFGEEHFMYTSCIMNCIYDCDYCYLQGMYRSRMIVIFVNLEDYFAALDNLLAKHPVYLCCSYDSDLTAFSGLLPHAGEFCRYALAHPELRIELRTKSAAFPFLQRTPAAKNIIMAFTLSPQEIITRYEHHTPPLKARLLAAKEAAKRGFSLRLCFDPILDVPHGEALYTALVEEVFSVLDCGEISDISLGVFRLPKEYFAQLKKAKPACSLSHYPYEQTDGVCHYRTGRCNELLSAVQEALHRHGIPDEKLFIWTPDESGKGEANAE